MVELQKYKVLELFLSNQGQTMSTVKMHHTFSYNVTYKPSEGKCLGLLNFTIKDAEDASGLTVKVSLVAEYSYGEQDDRKYIHKESFRLIFPYLRMMVTNLCTCAGLPGLIIPSLTISDDQIRNI